MPLAKVSSEEKAIMRRISEYELRLYQVLERFDYPAMVTLFREFRFSGFSLTQLEQLRDNLATLVHGLDCICCERKRESEDSSHTPKIHQRDGGQRDGRLLN
jgi:hypothetical protein